MRTKLFQRFHKPFIESDPFIVILVAQERSLFVKERRFGQSGSLTSLLAGQLADLTIYIILAAFWMLLIYFMVPFLYLDEYGPIASGIFFATLILTSDIGMSFLQVCSFPLILFLLLD